MLMVVKLYVIEQIIEYISTVTAIPKIIANDMIVAVPSLFGGCGDFMNKYIKYKKSI